MKDIYDFLRLQNDNFNIIECGGHLGNDTLKLANIFKNGVIYSIEANVKLYNDLIKNIHNNNVKIFNYCLSNKNGFSEFYIDANSEGDSGSSSILQSTESFLRNYIKKEDKIIIQSITLEDFMKSNNLEKIDLLWLDVEGFEYYILNNAIDMLKNIKYIYTEVNFQEFRKNGKLYDDIKSLLLNNNFTELYKWEQGAEWGLWQGNVLFRNNNIN
jgi:FkbM family methyltransferase